MKKRISLLSIFLILNSLFSPLMIYAEEVIPTPEPTPIVETSPTPTPEPTPESTPEPSISPTPEPTPLPTIIPLPSPTPEPQPTADPPLAETPNPSPTPSATESNDVVMSTGDATSSASVVNLNNITTQNSQYQVLTITIDPQTQTDVDLNQVWQNLLTASPSADFSNTINISQLNQTVTAIANTGSNQIYAANSATTVTGDATAIASAVNVVNTNLHNSTMLITLINILPGSTANLILPRPELFSILINAGINPYLYLNNADITASVSAQANTGDNYQIGLTNNLVTGTATAIANNVAMINTTLNNQQLFQWLTHSSSLIVSDVAPLTQTSTNLIQNDAIINSQVNAIANTGDNDQNSTTNNLLTGTAIAIANLINIINTNLINSRWLFGLTNIVGQWSGQAIYAYPDLSVTITPQFDQIQPGQTVTLNVAVSNQGYDVAHQPQLSIELPHQINITQNECLSLPDLSPNQHVNCRIQATVNPDYHFSKANNFHLFPQAYATDINISKTISVEAQISTPDPEQNTNNNRSYGTFTVYQSETSNTTTEADPVLSIETSHNVNEYVYPGDTITFFVNITNHGDGNSYNTQLMQTLFTSDGTQIGTVTFNLGTILAHRTGKLTFGLKLPKNSLPGSRFTIAQAYGDSLGGNSISSNQSRTDLLVRTHQYEFFPITPIQATDSSTPNPQILGSTSPPTKPPFNPVPLVIIVTMTGLWLGWVRRHFTIASTPMKIFFGTTTTLMLLATGFSLYQIGAHYHFFFLSKPFWSDNFPTSSINRLTFVNSP